MSILDFSFGKKRLFSLVFSLFMLLWGGYGLYVNDLLIPSLDIDDPTTASKPAYLLFAAFISGAMVLTSVVIAQVELKNNDSTQPTLGRIFGWTGWGLFASTLALHLLIELGHVVRL